MADLNERVEILERNLDDLRLDLHASKIAISVLSTVINSMSAEPEYLKDLMIKPKVLVLL